MRSTTPQRAATLLVSLLLAPLLACGATHSVSSALAPWIFHADWSGGFSGWMSFPLAQDIGYDPTLYTVKVGETTALQHNFNSHGEPTSWFGFIRPLCFTADARTRLVVRYRLDLSAALAEPELIFVGLDGHRHTTPLPGGNGEHNLAITGAQLHLATATPIVAIILRGRLEHPPLYSKSRWLIENFELHAERAPEVVLASPKLDATVDGSQVADITLSPSGALKIERVFPSLPATISLYDPTGANAGSQDVPAGTAAASLSLNAAAQPGLWKAEIAQGSARTSFRFLVLGSIPPHPRVLLSANRLEELHTESRYADLRRQIHQHAETLATKIAFNPEAGDNIALMPSGRGIGPTEPAQLKPYVELVEDYADAIAYNALDYRLNGNKAALTAARRALDAMMQWPTWVPPRFQQHGLYTYYEVGVIAQRVAFGYDLIGPELTSPEKEKTADAFWKCVIQPAVNEYFSYNRDPIAASNWMANSVGGAIEAAVAVAGDTPNWREREGPALAKLEFAYEQLLHGLFSGDGSESEPYGYENFAMQGISWGMSSLNALGIHPAGSERMIDGFWWPYYVTVRQGLQLDTGDFNGHLTGLPGFAWGAATSGIPELRALYDTGTNLDLMQTVETSHNGHLLEERLGPIDLVCCSKPAQSFTPPPTSRIFPLRGSAALRSGWSDDATIISLRVGPWFNHQHADEGSFQVAAFGTTLIDEAGYTNYYTDPRYADYFSQSAGHNTLLVDGNAFSQTAIASRFWPGFPAPHFTSHLLAGGIDYLAADLTDAYDGVLEHYEREFFFLKPGVLIVRDRVRSPAPHVFSFLLHAPAESGVTTNGSSAIFQTKTAAALISATGGNATWTVAQEPISSTLFTDLDHQQIKPRQEIQLSSWKTTTAQFLAGTTFIRGNPTLQNALKPLNSDNAVGFAATAANEPPRILFRSHPGALVLGAFSTDGDALAQNSADSYLAIAASQIQERGHPFLRSNDPADILWQRSGSALELHVFAAKSTTLQVAGDNSARSVTVDGKAIPVRYSDNMIVVPLSGDEEHHVSIQ
ncbi:MAG TPA: heparinase II/III family protein [Acidobacteriaceae bacterium]|nr:heparinase II/III family protein [Acidobacteriaceae bacterium]